MRIPDGELLGRELAELVGSGTLKVALVTGSLRAAGAAPQGAAQVWRSWPPDSRAFRPTPGRRRTGRCRPSRRTPQACRVRAVTCPR
ncbi:hypothetical protein [Streptomyces sp. NPDC051921]|uniref:hypothetical protein n=1 Tax=Streptomyces sp. NPDC051921 TaxID=3155806 RepID=UPI00343591F0